MNIIAALLIFTVIVVIHELGHFLLAKKHGVGVPEFSGNGSENYYVCKDKERAGLSIFLFAKEV